MKFFFNELSYKYVIIRFSWNNNYRDGMEIGGEGARRVPLLLCGAGFLELCLESKFENMLKLFQN